jgi:hypothetical protein
VMETIRRLLSEAEAAGLKSFREAGAPPRAALEKPPFAPDWSDRERS